MGVPPDKTSYSNRFHDIKLVGYQHEAAAYFAAAEGLLASSNSLRGRLKGAWGGSPTTTMFGHFGILCICVFYAYMYIHSSAYVVVYMYIYIFIDILFIFGHPKSRVVAGYSDR